MQYNVQFLKILEDDMKALKTLLSLCSFFPYDAES